MPATGSHGWHISEGWANAGKKINLLDKIYRPKAEWGAAYPSSDDGLLEDLKADTGLYLYVILGLDWHSQPLTSSDTWQNAWRNSTSKKLVLIWEDYSSDFVQKNHSFKEDMDAAALKILGFVDWIYTNHENNIGYFLNTFNFEKISFLPFAIDESFLKQKKLFSEKKDNLFFKGKIDNFGFEEGPYKKRREIIEFLEKKKAFGFEFNSTFVTDEEFVNLLDASKYHINLPSFSPSMTLRTFECLAIGGMLFQFFPSGKLTNSLFENTKDLIYYDPNNYDHLINEIIYYKKNTNKSTEIANNGNKKIIDFHTISKRYEQIIFHQKNKKKLTKSVLFKNLILSLNTGDSLGVKQIYQELEQRNLNSIDLKLIDELNTKYNKQKFEALNSKSPVIVIDMVFFQIAKNGIARVFDSIISILNSRGMSSNILIINRNNTYHNSYNLNQIITNEVNYENSSPEYITNDIDKILCRHFGVENNNFIFLSSYYTSSSNGFNIQIAHDMIPEILNGSEKVWHHKNQSLSIADFILCVSKNTQIDLFTIMPWVNKEKITYKLNGIPSEIFSLSKNLSETQLIETLPKLGLIQKKYFVFVGGRRGWKGYKNALVILKALNKFSTHNELKDFKVLFIGGDEKMEHAFNSILTEEARDKIVLKKAGDLEYLSFLKFSAGLIYPSIYEGFGLPILEAFSVGCQVISSSTSSLPEVGANLAFYFDPFSEDNLIEQIKKLLIENPQNKEELIKYAYSFEKNWSQIVDAMLHRYFNSKTYPRIYNIFRKSHEIIKNDKLFKKIEIHYDKVSIFN